MTRSHCDGFVQHIAPQFDTSSGFVSISTQTGGTHAVSPRRIANGGNPTCLTGHPDLVVDCGGWEVGNQTFHKNGDDIAILAIYGNFCWLKRKVDRICLIRVPHLFYWKTTNAQVGKKSWPGHWNQKGSRSWYRMFGGVVSFGGLLWRFEKMVSSSEALTPKNAKTYSHNCMK